MCGQVLIILGSTTDGTLAQRPPLWRDAETDPRWYAEIDGHLQRCQNLRRDESATTIGSKRALPV
jgi:hypothetical protein